MKKDKKEMTVITVRLEKELAEWLTKYGEQVERSRNNLIVHTLKLLKQAQDRAY